MQRFRIMFSFEFKTTKGVGGASPDLGVDAVFQMFDRGRPLVAQMYKQDVAEFAAGAATQRVQDGLVFAHGFPHRSRLRAKLAE